MYVVADISEKFVAVIFYPGSGEDRFIQNVCDHIQGYMASHARRPESTDALP
jgi:hypothetical protein